MKKETFKCPVCKRNFYTYANQYTAQSVQEAIDRLIKKIEPHCKDCYKVDEECPCSDDCEIRKYIDKTIHTKEHTETEIMQGRIKMMRIIGFYKTAFDKV